MTKGELKQHVPIFVGSTFEDMKAYRRAVRDALSQLETIVRGMEYFGSKPGSPIDECLAVVRSCRVYIGIFGMRYGSVPDGHQLSMTHLEYDEAQRSELPSLIYLIDEDAQPILPKFVETGPGADALRHLKEHLRKKHVVSAFTTPEDLAAKTLHDVPEVLRNIGASVTGELPKYGPEDAIELVRRFKLLPKMMKGREVVVDFSIDRFWAVGADECEALGLEAGATIRDYVTLSNGESVYVYASDQLAERLLDLPKGARVEVQAVTIYGVGKEVKWGDDGPITTADEHTGLRVKDIRGVGRAGRESAS